MATVNYDLSSLIDFPPLAKRYAKRLYKRNRRCSSDTRSRIDDLNDTLLELIFIMLSPWKYLVTSKCVSKRWNSIISNSYFLRSLTHEHYPFTLLLRRTNDYGRCLGQCVINEHPHFRKNKLCLSFIPSGFDFFHSNSRVVDIIAQNNDVLVTCRVSRNSKKVIEYCIANPLTKQYVVVPLPTINPVSYDDYRRVGIAGAVDGVSSVVNTATNTNHRGFRIVRVIKVHPLVVQIYSSETNWWTAYSFNNPNIHIFQITDFPKAVTLNNKVHWHTSSRNILVIDPFDIDIVPPYTLALPNGFDYYNGVLDICQNRLRFLRIAHIQKKQALKVWEVEDYNDNNNNLVCVAKLRLVIDLPLERPIIERELSQIDRLFSKEPYLYYNVDKVLCCHPNDPNVVYFFFRKTLYSYDAFTQRCKVVFYCTSDWWSEKVVLVHPLMVS